jgi:hypothetical protein
MKNTPALVVNLLTALTLFWPVPSLGGNEGVARVPDDATSHCRGNFPAVREESLISDRAVPAPFGSVMVFYDPCQHDPRGVECFLAVESPPPSLHTKPAAERRRGVLS